MEQGEISVKKRSEPFFQSSTLTQLYFILGNEHRNFLWKGSAAICLRIADTNFQWCQGTSWEKTVRLINTLKLIRECRGIANAKTTLRGKELEDFRRSLRELAQLNINPVTIPDDWKIQQIPNLLSNYYQRLAEERNRVKDEEFKKEVLAEYFKNRKWYSGVPFIITKTTEINLI